ncbi:MAG TPA: carboxymuconolactone decarboxylase family protein [Arenimonas sp.]|nr:carboxymuconolactone decarboxylase family protein [Arenimonas sp.]
MAAIPDYNALTAEISANLKPLRQDLPTVMKAFGELSKAASAPGALDEKTKEFVALGIAISTRCDACIGFHVRTLVKLGTSKAEFEEVLGMAVYMGGGPSLMYAANAMAAFDQFSAA